LKSQLARAHRPARQAGAASLQLQKHFSSQRNCPAGLARAHAAEALRQRVIYTLTIRDARTVAAWLRENGIDAESYWGGLDEELDSPACASGSKRACFATN